MSMRALLCLLAVTSACVAADPVPLVNRAVTLDLVEAVKTGDAAQVEELLADGMPASSVSADGDTPLCAALRLGMRDLAFELLDHGADVSACGIDHQPPIVLAALRRTPGVMKRLLEMGANPNVTAAFPVSPDLLQNIIDDVPRWILKRDSKVTPLMICAARGDVDSITLLMKGKADPEAQSSPNRFTALDLAGQCGYLYVMRLLLGRDPDTEPRVLVTVNLSRQSAVLEVAGKALLSTIVSTGRAGFATPAGHYVVTQKYKEWRSTVYKVSMPFFMRLNSGNFGLHSGYVTGSPASHGCIRLPDAMARKFFDSVTAGDEVIVEP